MGPGPAGIPQLEYLFSRLVCTSVPIGYTILLVILVIAGIKYITSGGEPKAISSAHQTATWGLLGILFLAISWLILLLIQNFTGLEVTKFTLASLPGVEGFTGSCWESPPAPESKSVVSTIQAKPVKTGFPFPVQKIMVPCTNPYDRMDPLPIDPGRLTSHSGYLLTPLRLFDLYSYLSDPLKDPGFAETIKKITTINVMSDEAVDHTIWHERTYGKTGIREQVINTSGIEYVPILGEVARQGKGYWLAKYEKGKIPTELINTRHEALQILKSLKEKGVNVYTYNNEVDFNTVSLLGYSCNDADFYVVDTDTPLIYLYPTYPLPVSIKLDIPILTNVKQYESAWKVIAFPGGKILNEDNNRHRFIPYEFLRRDFKRPSQGVVVNPEHLVGYLKDDLWKNLGLTNQEIEDYWNDLKGRVPNSPYYFISLIDRSEIDRVLPMEINPKPDTIIRNMTYILPLSSPYVPQPLPEDKLEAPERKGFIVLENGGFIDGF